MISWLQAFTQKHHKWLFSTLLLIVIVAFVFTIGNLPTCSRGGQRVRFEEHFYGYDLNRQDILEAIGTRTFLSARINGMRFYDDGQQQQAVLSRMLSLYFANQLNIPTPGIKELTPFVQGKVAFTGPDGQFQRSSFLEFLDQLNLQRNLSEDIFWQTMTEDWRIERVREAFGGPGYVLPYEAIEEVRLRRTRWDVQVVSLDYATFGPAIELSDADVQAYYEANRLNYQSPQRVQAAYAYVPLERFKDAGVAADEATLRMYFENNPGLFPGASDFESVRDRVINAYALKLARRKAEAFMTDDFVLRLYREEIDYGTETFNDLLNELGLKLVHLSPYSRDALPENTPLTEALLSEVFELSRYYSDPYPTKEGVAVLLVERILPSEIQPLEAVRENVVEDLREERRREAFVERGEQLREVLQAQAEAESFEAEAEALGLSVEAYRDFTLEGPPEGMNQVVYSALFSTRPGDVSEMAMRGDRGLFVYIEKKTVPDVAADDPDVAVFLSRLQINTAERAADNLFGELITRGLESAKAEEAKESQESESPPKE